MDKSVLIAGDEVIFEPDFVSGDQHATVMATGPVRLSGSGDLSRAGKAICVIGDEAEINVADCDYVVKDPYIIGGKGTLSITSLHDAHRSGPIELGNKQLLLAADPDSKFVARFRVTQAATTAPPESSPDPVSEYTGQGYFVGVDASIRARGCDYLAGNQITPGKGDLLIESVDAQPLSIKISQDGAQFEVTGTSIAVNQQEGVTFAARLFVTEPAKKGASSDSAKQYAGTLSFSATDE